MKYWKSRHHVTYFYPNKSVKYNAITCVLIKNARVNALQLNAAIRYQNILCYSMAKQFACLLADRTHLNYRTIIDSDSSSKNQKCRENLQVEMLMRHLLLLMGILQQLLASMMFQFELLRTYLVLIVIRIQFFLLQLDLRSYLMLFSAYRCRVDY